jgi:hypothetical protein
MFEIIEQKRIGCACTRAKSEREVVSEQASDEARNRSNLRSGVPDPCRKRIGSAAKCDLEVLGNCWILAGIARSARRTGFAMGANRHLAATV